MKSTTIRTKLTALILIVSLAVIILMWIMTVILFKPMYHATTQAALVSAIDTINYAVDPSIGLTDENVSLIYSIAREGICIEISTPNGRDVRVFEGIGDSCQLHGAVNFSSKYITSESRLIFDSPEAVEVRANILLNDPGVYSTYLEDTIGNSQAVKGEFCDNTYTIIASTSITRTESIVGIVTSQLRTASFIAIFLALIIAAVLSNWFTRPIMKLSCATKEIAKGNYKIKLEDSELMSLAV